MRIDRRLLTTQFRSDLKVFWRSPQSRYFTLLLPVVFLVIFAAIFNGTTLVDSNWSRSRPTTCRGS